MNIQKIIRLDKSISTGLVLKIFLPTAPGEIEHALHILLNGSVFIHEHSDKDGITEGYRELNLETCEFSKWEVVGAKMPMKIHGISPQKGLRIIEGSKRGAGIDCWPELKSN